MLLWAMVEGLENTGTVPCLQGCSKTLWFPFLALLKEIRTWGHHKISSCYFVVNQDN